MAHKKVAKATTPTPTPNPNPTEPTPTPAAQTEADAAKAQQDGGKPKLQATKLRGQAKALRAAAAGTGNPQVFLDRADALEREADALDPRPAKATKEPKPKAEPRPTCNATKLDGTPCTAKAMAGKDHCTDHRPPHEHLSTPELGFVANGIGNTDPTAVAWAVAAIGWGRVRAMAKAAGVGQPKAE